jgi:uncharacterized delta-60 repeat protein
VISALDPVSRNSIPAVRAAIVSALLIASPAAHAGAGDVDATYAPVANGPVHGVAIHFLGGEAILGGDFTTLNTAPRGRSAALDTSGSFAYPFNPGANSTVFSTAVLRDGLMAIAGSFTIAGGVTRNRLARFTGSGILDATFDPNANGTVYSMAVQRDGKIVVAGNFSMLSGLARTGIARLQSTGALDMGFNPNPGGSIPSVSSVAMQTDGKILLAGDFTSVGGVVRNRIARVNADGTIDATFNPDANARVFCIAVQADGKFIVGGDFTAVGGVARSRLARLHPDGSLDLGFDPGANGIVYCALPQTDRALVITGSFSNVGGVSRNAIARFKADGTLDTTFLASPNAPVFGGAVQADGKIVIGGVFSVVSGASRISLARLNNDAATQLLTVSNASRVQWMRGGASPETQQVTFEFSTNGGSSWTVLGAGARIPGGWEKTGLSLPASGIVRARAVIPSGGLNGSSGLMISNWSPLQFTDADSDGLLDSWELTYWPTTAGHSAGEDFDSDGLTELEELAFGLNPTIPDSQLARRPIVEGGYLTITITKHTGSAYEVQSAGTLLTGQPASFSPATTTVLLDNGTTLKVRDNVLIGTPPSRFLRVKVTAAP